MTDFPDDVAAASSWMKRERGRRGWSTTQLAHYARQIAKREGSTLELKQQSVSGFENKVPKKIPDWLRFVKMAFEEGEPAGLQDTSPRDELVYVREVDIRFAMGDGSELEDYPEINLVPFNLNFLRRVSAAPSEKLFLAKGFGDSMEPLLLKDDHVLVDTSDRSIGIGDTIWALRYAGSGYIKRLRRIKHEGEVKVEIMSINPNTPAMPLADPDDVEVIGRVVWLARTV